MASQHSASLYVGDLHETITEALLYEVFREVGPIISIRVCRDAASRKSLGYAYVNFQNAIDAERALDALNYTIIKGKPIRIMWSQRDPSVRRSGIGNIFIKNLDKSIDNKALYDTFSAFGNILSCKVSTKQDKVVKGDDDKVNYRGYGFVHFETQEAAEQAVAKVNGMLLNGKKVYVGPFIKRSERLKLINADEKYTNVFVKNVDKNVTKEELEKAFTECGEIQHAELAMDEHGKSKGFGFINYKKHEDAVKAADVLNGKEIKGKKIYVARHQRREERVALIKDLIERKKLENNKKYQGANLYVKNLDDSFDDSKLKEIFVPFGAITCAKVMMRDDKPNVSRGFGFVNFEHPEDATKALAEMSGKIVGSKPLYVAIAQKKEVRKLQLEAQFRHRGVPFQQGAMSMPLPFPPNAAAQPPMHFYPPQARPFGMPPQYPQKPRWFAPQRNNAQQQPQVMQGAPNSAPQGGPAPTAASGASQPMSYAQVIARGGPAPASVQQGVGAVPQNIPQRGHHPRRGGHQQFGVPQNQQRGNATRGYKYNQNARNRPDQQAPVQQGVAPQAPVQGAPVERADNALTLTNLSDFTPDEQKQIIGDRLFPLVHMLQPAYSQKITGMFLEMETSDLLHLIESPEALNAKVQEAVVVLKDQPQQ